MSALYLLDTNALSEPARPQPSEAFMRRLDAARGEIATAAPVWHELLFGCRRLTPSPRRRTLERYLGLLAVSLEVLPYDSTAADWHAEERARFEGTGRRPAFVDGQIAAIARTRHLKLVTRNVSDFDAFEGLEVDNWHIAEG